MKNLLAAVDFSKTTQAVIDQSAQLAKALDAKLWVLHVCSEKTQAIAFEATSFDAYAPEYNAMPGDIQLARNINAEEIKREHRELLGISSRLREEGVNAQAVLMKGGAAEIIIQKAAELDAMMVLLGSHGHGLLHKVFLGSVSESVLRHAPCNVLVVPSPKS